MKTKVSWARVAIIGVLLLGICFRFTNLDRKVPTTEEVLGLFWTSGYSFQEADQWQAELDHQAIETHQAIDLSDLKKVRQPNSQKNVFHLIKNMAIHDNRHPPLYYAALQVWVKVFGTSIVAARSFSAVLSLLVFPGILWLCRELFKSPKVGYVATMLVAVSPIQILYAQHIRQFSLVTGLTLLASAALLRSLRLKNNWFSWGLYAILVTAGLYTFPLLVLMLFGHGLYVATLDGFRLRRNLRSFGTACLGIFIAFLPWLYVLLFIEPILSAKGWQTARHSLIFSLTKWAGIVSRAFIDFNASPSQSGNWVTLLPLGTMILILFAGFIYTGILLVKQAPKNVWLFLLISIGANSIPLIIPDLLLGQYRGTSRYLLPCLVLLQVAVAYMLTQKSFSLSTPLGQRRIWQGVTGLIIGLGVLSCGLSSQAAIWWSNAPELNADHPAISQIINHADNPLLIIDLNQPPNPEGLIYLLNDNVSIFPSTLDIRDLSPLSEKYGDIFVVSPTESFKQQFDQDQSAWELNCPVGPLCQINAKYSDARVGKKL